MRVGLVVHRYPPALGGVERHVGELARGLSRRGIAVEVITCDPTGTLPPRSVDAGVEVNRFATLGGDDVYYVSPALARWLMTNAGRFDLIHAHSYHTANGLTAFVATRAASLPFVLTPHYHGEGHTLVRRLAHVPYRPLGRLMVRAARPLVCVSKVERELLRRDFGRDLAAVIAPNGVDVDAIRAAEPFPGNGSGQLILAAGRLEGYKQVAVIVDALTHLPADARLVITGDGPARPELEQRAKRIGVADRVNFLGQVETSELYRWFQTADTFVTMSTKEAFGIALLEAAVGGAGLVATEIAAHREVAGYLPNVPISFVPPTAAGRELARAISSSRRRSPMAADLDRVPRWEDTVRQTLKAYDVALGRRQARHLRLA